VIIASEPMWFGDSNCFAPASSYQSTSIVNIVMEGNVQKKQFVDMFKELSSTVL
jgi:hypothetical protein